MTFYGGRDGKGKHDAKAKLRAMTEIEEQIAIAQRQSSEDELSSLISLQERATNKLDAFDFMLASSAVEARYAKAAEAGEPLPANPLMEELRQLKEENTQLRSQMKLMGVTGSHSDEPLKVLQEKYAALMKQQGKAEGKHQSTINEYAKSSLEFIEFLAERNIQTTAQLEQASAVVAEFRDDWLSKIENGASKSMARRMLLGSKQFTEWMLSREYISKMPPAINRRWSSVGKDEAKPTYLTVAETRKLFKAAPIRLKLPILLGINAGYRVSDLLSLKRTDCDMEKGIIARQRHKTGKAQCHKLWDISKRYLQAQLDETDGDPFAKGYTNISKELTEFMQQQVSQTPDKRTAKTLRATGANELEKLLKGKDGKTVSQYLSHQDSTVAKYYRDSDTQTLFESLDALGKVFKLAD